MAESDEPSEFDKSFVSSVGSSKSLGIIDEDVLGVLSRLPIKFKEQLAALGVRIICCRTLADAYGEFCDPTLLGAKEDQEAMFSVVTKTLYVANNPHIEEMEKTPVFNAYLELMRGYAVLTGIDKMVSLTNATLSDNLLMTNLPEDPIRRFALCAAKYLCEGWATPEEIRRAELKYPETMRFAKQQLEAYIEQSRME
jgi:hypothetical protein